MRNVIMIFALTVFIGITSTNAMGTFPPGKHLKTSKQNKQLEKWKLVTQVIKYGKLKGIESSDGTINWYCVPGSSGICVTFDGGLMGYTAIAYGEDEVVVQSNSVTGLPTVQSGTYGGEIVDIFTATLQ